MVFIMFAERRRFQIQDSLKDEIKESLLIWMVTKEAYSF
jgi:hypothetical protein